MTSETIQELANEIRPRYLRAGRVGKTAILDEFCLTTRYHRKAAIRLLNRKPVSGGQPKKSRGRPALYRGGELLSALLVLWEASGFVCSKYLPAALPALITRLEQGGSLLLTDALRRQLLTMSAATAERLVKPHRPRHLGRPNIQARNSSDLSHKIAVHTFYDLRGLPVGHLEIDLVLHCGMTTQGFYLCTLVAVDTASSWTQCIPVWGKGQERVGGAAARLQRELPFPVQRVYSDNGSEFINELLYTYWHRHNVELKRSRPNHKNDQPRVEQRNGSLVRRVVGYARYTSRAAFAQLEIVYQLVCTHANFFRPTMKLLARERRGARIVAHYDAPQTPYQRLLASGQLTPEQQAHLEQQFQSLDPLALQRALSQAVTKLWTLEAVDPASERARRLSEAVRATQAQ